MVKNLFSSAGDAGSIPGSGRSPAGGNGNPLQYSCLVNPMDRGAWRATVHGVTKYCVYVNPNLPIHPSPLLYTLAAVFSPSVTLTQISSFGSFFKILHISYII